MRYMSQIFQPLISIPKNAKIKNLDITCKSQKLLLECGLIRPTSSGLFALLPLANRALTKLQRIVEHHLTSLPSPLPPAQRITLPSLTPASLWARSGRLDIDGLIKLKDRHEKDYLLAPTHEETITELLADVGPLSYKQLPLLLYQIGPKFRDELRPKHGILRAREFLMLDAYSAHETRENVAETYAGVNSALKNAFEDLGLDVRRVKADASAMGGTESHEWQLPATAGEDTVCGCGHTECDCPAGDKVNSIEVAHTFILGERYSEPLKALAVRADGTRAPVHMACYGIGVTRLLAASLEALSTDTELRWPRGAAPYDAVVITPKAGSPEWSAGWALGQQMAANGDTLLDDRHHLTVGRRLLQARRMGYPLIIICGKSALEGRCEVIRAEGGGLAHAGDVEETLRVAGRSNKRVII